MADFSRASTSYLICAPFLDTTVPASERAEMLRELRRRGYWRPVVFVLRVLAGIGLWWNVFAWEWAHLDIHDVLFGYLLNFGLLAVASAIATAYMLVTGRPSGVFGALTLASAAAGGLVLVLARQRRRGGGPSRPADATAPGDSTARLSRLLIHQCLTVGVRELRLSAGVLRVHRENVWTDIMHLPLFVQAQLVKHLQTLANQGRIRVTAEGRQTVLTITVETTPDGPEQLRVRFPEASGSAWPADLTIEGDPSGAGSASPKSRGADPRATEPVPAAVRPIADAGGILIADFRIETTDGRVLECKTAFWDWPPGALTVIAQDDTDTILRPEQIRAIRRRRWRFWNVALLTAGMLSIGGLVGRVLVGGGGLFAPQEGLMLGVVAGAVLTRIVIWLFRDTARFRDWKSLYPADDA